MQFTDKIVHFAEDLKHIANSDVDNCLRCRDIKFKDLDADNFEMLQTFILVSIDDFNLIFMSEDCIKTCSLKSANRLVTSQISFDIFSQISNLDQ